MIEISELEAKVDELVAMVSNPNTKREDDILGMALIMREIIRKAKYREVLMKQVANTHNIWELVLRKEKANENGNG